MDTRTEELKEALTKLSEAHIILKELNTIDPVTGIRNRQYFDDVLDQVWQYQVDGIIAAAQFTHEQINACNDRGTPLVFYNRIYPESTINSVCCDHEEGERLLVDQLVKDGRRSFVVMSGPSDSAVSTARTRGAISKLNERSARLIQVEGDYSYDTASDLQPGMTLFGQHP